ncbi:MAG: type II toxin-antitoxin system prevent-host-death family antitoxin [Pseudomonadota bacterium]|nr:type II toxin-antitoxin system prevent-host-death family antitoxin [Pseudomonadota bacterium]
MQVNMLEAKNQLSRLVKAAQAGEEVIIANHGVPVVRILPMESSEPARSLADELAGLRALLREEDAELALPPRIDRADTFMAAIEDDHVVD